MRRARQYLNVHSFGVNIKDFLGDGTDGAVWATTNSTAVKVFERPGGYFNERDTYQRLKEFGFTESIEGFWVPEMHGYDDDLMVVEMDFIQSPPYIIDFAKVRIDRPPDFSEETLSDLEVKGQSLFGEDWGRVKLLMATLESIQIYYLDPNASNIVLRPRDTQ